MFGPAVLNEALLQQGTSDFWRVRNRGSYTTLFRADRRRRSLTRRGRVVAFVKVLRGICDKFGDVKNSYRIGTTKNVLYFERTNIATLLPGESCVFFVGI